MKSAKFSTPDDYVAALEGWQRKCVRQLRKAVTSAPRLDEVIKWGHLVYMCNGPVLLIRAEEERVLFGFWRGQRLRETEPRLKASGKYEMATIELHEGDSVKPAVARRLAKEAQALKKNSAIPVMPRIRPRDDRQRSGAAGRGGPTSRCSGRRCAPPLMLGVRRPEMENAT